MSGVPLTNQQFHEEKDPRDPKGRYDRQGEKASLEKGRVLKGEKRTPFWTTTAPRSGSRGERCARQEDAR